MFWRKKKYPSYLTTLLTEQRDLHRQTLTVIELLAQVQNKAIADLTRQFGDTVRVIDRVYRNQGVAHHRAMNEVIRTSRITVAIAQAQSDRAAGRLVAGQMAQELHDAPFEEQTPENDSDGVLDTTVPPSDPETQGLPDEELVGFGPPLSPPGTGHDIGTPESTTSDPRPFSQE